MLYQIYIDDKANETFVRRNWWEILVPFGKHEPVLEMAKNVSLLLNHAFMIRICIFLSIDLSLLIILSRKLEPTNSFVWKGQKTSGICQSCRESQGNSSTALSLNLNVLRSGGILMSRGSPFQRTGAA